VFLSPSFFKANYCQYLVILFKIKSLFNLQFIMLDKRFTIGERVLYNGEIWEIVWISDNGRMVDLVHEVTGYLQKMVYTTDLE
jgi:hypothetical protein